MGSHQATHESERTVGSEEEALVAAFAALGVESPSSDIEWVRCEGCHTLYDHRVIGGTGQALACINCVPGLIPNWEMRGGPAWTHSTLVRNRLMSVTTEGTWQSRTIEALLDTGELDLTDSEAVNYWFWQPSLWDSSTRLFRAYDTRSAGRWMSTAYVAPKQTAYDEADLAPKHLEN